MGGRRLSDDEKRARKIERELTVSLRHAARDDKPEKRTLSPAERKEHRLKLSREWKRRNPEKIAAYSHVRYWRDPERARAQARKDQANRRARLRAAKIEAERAKVRAYKKAWRRANRERELARGRADSAKFRKSNPESVCASQRKWREKNRDYFRQHDRDRYAANPEKFKAKRRLR